MKIADIVSIVLTALLGAGGLVYSLTGAKGTSVLISTPDASFTYPLDAARTVKVPGEHGTLTIGIEGGKVRIVKSPCPNQICVHKGWCEIAGDSIICVPEKTVVKITGELGVDAVSE